MNKKRWKILEVNDILNLKKFGIKTKTIAEKYSVTANTIRKLMERYDENKIKKKFSKRNNDKETALKNFEDYLLFNKKKIKNGLPLFRISFD